MSMDIFPIMRELFESDSVIFLAAGVFLSAVICIRSPERLKRIMLISAGIYIICEIIAGLRTNYLTEILTLIAGTAALGCALGSGAEILVMRAKGETNHQKL